MRERWFKRHAVCGNPVNSPVSVKNKSANVITEYFEGSDGRALEYVGASGIHFRWSGFGATVFRVQVNVTTCVDVAAYFPDAFTEAPFIPFLRTDKVLFCSLEGTVHRAKESHLLSLGQELAVL